MRRGVLMARRADNWIGSLRRVCVLFQEQGCNYRVQSRTRSISAKLQTFSSGSLRVHIELVQKSDTFAAQWKLSGTASVNQ